MCHLEDNGSGVTGGLCGYVCVQPVEPGIKRVKHDCKGGVSGVCVSVVLL